mgnify:CR=1 FL=1
MKTIYLAWKSIILTLLLLQQNPLLKSQSFNILKQWNFENRSTGTYTDAMVGQDFNHTVLFSHNTASIVNDQINGSSTKVMRIKHPANTVSNGFEMNVNLEKDYNELWLSFNWKFGNEFNSTHGGKLPGLGGLPDFGTYCPVGEDGFRCHNLFKWGNRISSYHYDRTTGICPWAVDEDSVFMTNGTWYNITQRLVMNTFTNGVANADGIKEVWINGKLVLQERNLKLMTTNRSDMKIDAFRLANFYGGSGSAYLPKTEGYTYIDNIKVFLPLNDPIVGTRNVHNASTIISTPDPASNESFYYDRLITSAGTLSNTQYPSTYSSCIDEAYLIDAGANNRVKFEIKGGALGGNDYLFFYDGNKSNAKLIHVIKGSSSNLVKTITSSQRYLFIRFSSSEDVGSTGWTGTISFLTQSVSPLTPPSNLSLTSTSSGINISWKDNCSRETGYKVDRSLSSGTGFQTINTTTGGITSCVDNNVTAGQKYYYRISGINETQQSAYCDEKSIVYSPAVSIINVAPGKSVKQSSTAYNGAPERAIDGNTNGSWSSNSVSHTARDLNSWWEIDLGRSYSINNIEIWNRTDVCCIGRLTNYYVFVSDNPFSSTNLTNTMNQSGVWKQNFSNYPDPMQLVNPGRTARYIRIQSTATVELNLAEVVVNANINQAPEAPSGPSAVANSSSEIALRWTDNSSNENGFRVEKLQSGEFVQIASLPANTVTYTDKYLSPSTTYYYRVAAYNAYGTSNYCNQVSVKTDPAPQVANIAPGKIVKQSSTVYGGVAIRAIDGNTNGTWNAGSVTHTGKYQNSWWEIDLGKKYEISSVEVWNRTDPCCADRLSNYYILISDNPFNSSDLTNSLNQSGVWDQYFSIPPDPMVSVTPGRTGRYIRIQCYGIVELSLAEVKVNAFIDPKDEDLTSIEETTNQNQNLNVFPNPASEQITINYKVDSDSRISIELYSISGALTEILVDDYKTPGTYSEVFHLGTLNNEIKPGIYLIVFRNEKEYLTRKVVITQN